MYWLIDVGLIIITLVIILMYTYKGFVKAVLGAFKFVFALVFAIIFAKPVGGFISDAFIYGLINNAVNKNLTDLLNKTQSQVSVSAVINKLPDFLVGWLDSVGVSFESMITETENTMLTGENLSSISASIATPISSFISGVIAFVLIFILSLIVLAIAAFFLDKLFKAPGLKQLNRALGCVFGIINAFITLLIICTILTFVFNCIGLSNPEISAEIAQNHTFVYRLISNINVFSWFL